MRQLGFDTAVVQFERHMMAAVKIANDWRLYDADREISPAPISIETWKLASPLCWPSIVTLRG